MVFLFYKLQNCTVGELRFVVYFGEVDGEGGKYFAYLTIYFVKFPMNSECFCISLISLYYHKILRGNFAFLLPSWECHWEYIN